jgi:hypothetical protein
MSSPHRVIAFIHIHHRKHDGLPALFQSGSSISWPMGSSDETVLWIECENWQNTWGKSDAISGPAMLEDANPKKTKAFDERTSKAEARWV